MNKPETNYRKIRIFGRVSAAAVALIAMSGCAAIPIGLSAVANAGEGLSLGASGKSVTDHALSQATDMDCSVLRIFGGEWICRERGIDKDDNTLYPSDVALLEGPARPWGTMNEPQSAEGPNSSTLIAESGPRKPLISTRRSVDLTDDPSMRYLSPGQGKYSPAAILSAGTDSN